MSLPKQFSLQKGNICGKIRWDSKTKKTSSLKSEVASGTVFSEKNKSFLERSTRLLEGDSNADLRFVSVTLPSDFAEITM